MSDRYCKIGTLRLTATLFVMTGALWASPAVGFVSQTFRTKIPDSVNVNNQWEGPLFNLQIQSWNGEGWGFDIVQGTTEFAAAVTSPSQSGWHDHPTALTIAQVVQGTVWIQEKPDYGCLRAYPTGSIFFERAGTAHNVWNLDATTPAVTRVIHFVPRTESATRRDQPDPVSGSNAVAMMPPLCPPVAAGSSAPDGAITAASTGLYRFFLDPQPAVVRRTFYTGRP
jgi:hypothetical protein